jgi:uncharacterized protein YggE
VIAVLLAGYAGQLQTDASDGGTESTISVSASGSATADADRAMSAARTDADGLAAAAGRSVTGVERVTTATGFAPGPVTRFGDAADGTVLQPTPVWVTATVDVTYSAR